jgi:hypothetical protein
MYAGKHGGQLRNAPRRQAPRRQPYAHDSDGSQRIEAAGPHS